MAIIGTIITRLTANSTTFDRKMKKSAGMVGAFRKQASQLKRLLLTGLGFVGLIRVLNLASAATAKQEASEAKLNAVIEATGGAARRTAKQLTGMASELQALTTFGDEDIINMQAILATFKNIKGIEFDSATRAVLDLSAALDQDLKSAAILVGKALNDPVLGLTAMGRAGITFSNAQKQQIKGFVQTNQMARAQGVILRELESQFGGVAEAMADTWGGRTQQAINMASDQLEGFLGKVKFGLVEVVTLGGVTRKLEADRKAAFQGKIAGNLAASAKRARLATASLVELLAEKKRDPIKFAAALNEFVEAATRAQTLGREGSFGVFDGLGAGVKTLRGEIASAWRTFEAIEPLAIKAAAKLKIVETAMAEIKKLAAPVDPLKGIPFKLALKLGAARRAAAGRNADSKLIEEGKKLTEAMRTPAQKYAAALERLNKMRRLGGISAETHARKLKLEREALRKNGTARKRLQGIMSSVSAFTDRVRRGRDEQRKQKLAQLQFAGLPQAVEGSSMFRGIAAAFKRDEEKRLSVERNEILKDINSKQPKSFIGRVIDWVS